ncbi:MAG: TniQ family protein, partial [Pseudorhodobacter sp.]|nr:TniQ family protein [Frankiaceae bacterium]
MTMLVRRAAGASGRGLLARSLPIRIEPLEDEAFDGYLEYVADKLCTDPRDLLSQFHLPERDETPYRLVRSFSTPDTEMICRTLNLEPSEVLSMTLARWRQLGLTPPRTERRGNFAGAWPRGAGARYCPLCLRERNYRVRLTDRLQHVYVCPVHHVWLETICPICQRPPRSRARFYPHAPPAKAATLSCRVGCAASVLAEVTPKPVLAGPYVKDYGVVLQLLGGRSLDVWDGRLPADLALLDLASLTRLALNEFGRQQITSDCQMAGVDVGDDGRAALAEMPHGTGTPRLARAVDDVRVGAYALAVAVHVMQAGDETQAKQRLAWVTSEWTRRPSRTASPVSAQLTRVLQECLP